MVYEDTPSSVPISKLLGSWRVESQAREPDPWDGALSPPSKDTKNLFLCLGTLCLGRAFAGIPT